MDIATILPWVMFALAVVGGSWFAVRGMRLARDEALRAKEEAQRERDAMVAQLQAELMKMQDGRPAERQQLEMISKELTALRERMAHTGAELNKLHTHDREIRTMMSSLLTRARKLTDDDDEPQQQPPAFRASQADDLQSQCSQTDTLHLEFLKAQEAQLEEIRKKSQRLNLIVPSTPANLERSQHTAAIFSAIRKNDLDGVRSALLSGGDVNGKDPHNGFTPLHLAAREGRPQLVAELLAKGADLDAADNFGKTALRVAQEVANGDCAELLRSAKAR